jgi:hypothetical protein
VILTQNILVHTSGPGWIIMDGRKNKKINLHR